MRHIILFILICKASILSVFGQNLPVFQNNESAKPKKNKEVSVVKNKSKVISPIATPQNTTKLFDGYYEYFPISKQHLYSGILKDGSPSGYAFIYSRNDTTLLYEGELKNGVYNADDIPTKNQDVKEHDYGYFLEQGETALNQGNKKEALIFFRKASLAYKGTNATDYPEKMQSIANESMKRGDKFYGLDEYATALDWYLIVQSLINNESIQTKIKECKSKL